MTDPGLVDGQTLGSVALIALTVLALVATRSRGLAVRAAVELALVAGIGAFLAAHGAAPVLHAGDAPSSTWFDALKVIWWLLAARLVANFSFVARGRDPRSREVRLFSELIAAAIHVTAVLIILNSVFGLPVKGILATSGVVAIVVGLALQNTLADVFSGLAVGMEKPFHLGDRISLGESLEGIVVQINWRSVRIRTDGDDLATVPNSVIAKGQITNRSVPTARRSASVEIEVSSAAGPEKVVELMRQASLLVKQVMAMPAPVTSLRRSSLDASTYALHFFVPDSAVLAAAKSALLIQSRRLLWHAGLGSASATPTPSELLGSLVIFEALSPVDLRALAEAAIVHRIDPGEVVFEQGSAGTSIYVVQAGILELTRRQDTAIETLGRIGPGEYIGELGLVAHAPRGVTLAALTTANLLELPAASVQGLIASNAALGAAMERSVRKGLAFLQRDEAARLSNGDTQGSALLARIRRFFGG